MKTSIAQVALLVAILMAATAHAADEPDTWVLRGAKVYVAPEGTPIADGIVVIRGDKILAVGDRRSVNIPAGARASACDDGGVVAAGFQNSHVHFIGDVWNDAGRQPAGDLSRLLTAMLTRYGYSTVVDTASDRDNTLAMRARIERSEVRGPRILTVGLPLFPPKGIPIYLEHFPREFLERMPQPATAEGAVNVVRENLDAGADGTKLFVVTPQAGGLRRMGAEVARAAADETHRRGKLVMAHPTDIDGVRAALAAGVDILAHTTLGVEAPWPEELQRQAIKQGMSVIPTLKLLGHELDKEKVPPEVTRRLVAASVAHVRAFVAAGGQVLFGTDAGYMSDFDPTEEYVLMARAGLTPMQILASLTTAPAARWNEAGRRGRVAAGLDADLVVLEADPAADPANFAKVRCTISRGRTVYPAPGKE
ncbi:MAG: amidohydrolase family protein [Betaproteobacteria bacterium]|nr:amidohydrolase family protein [Betaproteobacteria bacterium]